MNEEQTPNIVFLRVTNTEKKLSKIASCVNAHFLSGDKMVIFVPNSPSATYIDKLLWQLPKESFIPHKIVEKNSSCRIAITLENTNVNKANIALNLTQKPCPFIDAFERVYELLDQTSKEKVEVSQKKMKSYGKKVLSIS